MSRLMDPIEFEIKTYGCKVNSYDTGLMEKRLEAKGEFRRVDDSSSAGPKVYILNTCAVTDEASKEAVRQVRRLKAKSPFSKVVVTGCAAQVDTDKFFNLPGVDLVVANSHKAELESLVSDLFKGKLTEKIHKSSIFKKDELGVGGGHESRHTRSFLKIQDGCNSFCTFCVIPFARGKSRSIPISTLLNKTFDLYEQGVREVVLTGVHVGDYEDGSKCLEDLVETILEKSPMERIRLTSLEPVEINDRLFDLYTHEKMCPHFHISLQSAQTRTLHRMKRNYGHKEVEWALNEIEKRYDNPFVGMDIIAGFPGETDKEFEEAYARMASLPWTRMHVFPYSPRPGTYATRLDGQMERSKIMARAARLRELSHDRFGERAVAQVGSTKQVLVLNNGKQGLSRDFWRVQLPEGHDWQPGSEVNLSVKGFDTSKGEGDLVGEFLNSNY